MSPNPSKCGIENYTPEEMAEHQAQIARNKANVALAAARYTVRNAVRDIEQAGFVDAAMKTTEALSALDRAAVELRALDAEPEPTC